MNTMLIAFSNT